MIKSIADSKKEMEAELTALRLRREHTIAIFKKIIKEAKIAHIRSSLTDK